MLNPFKVVQITDEQTKQSLYRLRYNVYVEEFGFENAQSCTDGLEFDLYDEQALQFAAYNSCTLIGTTRLILSDVIRLPFESITGIHIPVHSAEISRMTVLPEYRGLFITSLQFGVFIRLIKILWQTSKKLHLLNWYLLITDTFYKFLHRIGFMVNQVQQPVEHHGQRLPCMITLNQFEKRLKNSNLPLYEFICS